MSTNSEWYNVAVTQYLLHSTSSGQGQQTVVLLHGYLSSSQYFKHIRKRLEEEYRVVALDLLGFGRSPKPRIDYTYDDHIAAIHYTLDQLGIKRPYVLLGHSMGALIALRYATVHGDDISKLLLFNPPLFTDRSQMIGTHRATGRRYRIMLYSRGRHIYWLVLRLLPKNKSPRRSAISFSDTISMSPAAREGSYRHVIGAATVFSDLRRVTVPTLLVNGRHDRVVYLENLQGRRLPALVTLSIIESGHHPLVRNVDMSNDLIQSFLCKKAEKPVRD